MIRMTSLRQGRCQASRLLDARPIANIAFIINCHGTDAENRGSAAGPRRRGSGICRVGILGRHDGYIAAQAGVSTGNLYRYFTNKDELFYSILTDDFVESFLRLLRRRVKSLLDAENLADLDADTQRDAQDLLGFWVTHRLKSSSCSTARRALATSPSLANSSRS